MIEHDFRNLVNIIARAAASAARFRYAAEPKFCNRSSNVHNRSISVEGLKVNGDLLLAESRETQKKIQVDTPASYAMPLRMSSLNKHLY